MKLPHLHPSLRFKAALVLLVFFFLILLSNRMDRRHFDTVQHTVNSVYADRLVVQDYIYQLKDFIDGKRVELAQNDKLLCSTDEKERIAGILTHFENTHLTQKEALYLDEFRDNYKDLLALSGKYTSGDDKALSDIHLMLERIDKDLDELAQIQLEEGKTLTMNAQKSLDFNQLFGILETASLILIGVGLMFLVFYKPRREEDMDQVYLN